MEDKKHNSLEYFKSLHQKYLTGEYVFKKCIDDGSKDKSRKWLVVLQKTDKTITNESRKNVFDPKYAKFRGNEFKVIKIININESESIKDKIINILNINESESIKDKIVNVYKNHKLEYKVGEIVKVDNYNMDLEAVCSTGIHYFKTFEPAYFYEEVPKNFTGTYYSWHPNGQKRIECECVNDVLNGKYIEWYENGQKHQECEYANGVLNGKYIEWYKNGRKYQEYEYLKGVLSGKYIEWYENGEKYKESEYINGKLSIGQCVYYGK